MMTIKKTTILATVALLLSSPAFAADAFKSVVHDSNGGIVRDTNGGCVLTQWDAKNNECTGEKAKSDIEELTKELRTVYFDFNKSTLNAKEKAKLDKVAKLIKDSKAVESVDISGYADTIGKSSYNKKLSAARAASVKAYLAKKGLKTNKVTVEAFGEEHPIAKCDPALARKELIVCLAEDRRVEIKLNLLNPADVKADKAKAVAKPAAKAKPAVKAAAKPDAVKK